MKLKSLYCLISILFAGFLFGCDTTTEGYTTLLDSDQAPLAERGGVAMDNQFYVASGNQILQLSSGPDGTQQTSLIYEREDCAITGMATTSSKIYAACTTSRNPQAAANGQPTLPQRSELVRIDLSKAPSDPTRIAETSGL